MKRIFSVYIAVLMLLCLCACGGAVREDLSCFAMDTYVNISIYRPEDRGAVEQCFTLINSWENLISVTREESEIAQLNRRGEGELSGEVAELCKLSLDYAALTHGAFDPTLLSLKVLWDIQNRTEADPLPTDGEIQKAREQAGYRKVSLSGNDCVLNGVMGLDLGGIAKGYLGDLCAKTLKENGVDNAIINMGGNVRLVGDETYNVGILDPRGEDGALLMTLSASDCSIVTSGDYERYFEVDGARYHHIFDPATGCPAKSGLTSVTVIGKDGALCDALSTAFFVMGVEDAASLIREEQLDVDAVFVEQSGKVWVTSPIKDDIDLAADSYELAVLP